MKLLTRMRTLAHPDSLILMLSLVSLAFGIGVVLPD